MSHNFQMRFDIVFLWEYSLGNMSELKETENVTAAYIDTKEAAKILGYTLQHTRLLIRTGQLKAVKFGRDWMIERKSITDLNNQKDISKKS